MEELYHCLVPSVWVIQIARMPRPFHHHHFVIGQFAEVAERQFSKLFVFVAVNYQSWNLLVQGRERKASDSPPKENQNKAGRAIVHVHPLPVQRGTALR